MNPSLTEAFIHLRADWNLPTNWDEPPLLQRLRCLGRHVCFYHYYLGQALKRVANRLLRIVRAPEGTAGFKNSRKEKYF